MESREWTISLPSDCKVEGVNIKAGVRKNNDTLVDVRVGPVIILEVEVTDEHWTPAVAFLPSDLNVSDPQLEDAITHAALSYHYGVDEQSLKEEEEADADREMRP